MVRDMDTGKS
jgi:RNA-binding motif X-linked protein 2